MGPGAQPWAISRRAVTRGTHTATHRQSGSLAQARTFPGTWIPLQATAAPRGAGTGADSAGAVFSTGRSLCPLLCQLLTQQSTPRHWRVMTGAGQTPASAVEELGAGILATCYLWPPSLQGAFMHRSPQLPMGTRDLPAGDTSGAELVLRAEPASQTAHLGSPVAPVQRRKEREESICLWLPSGVGVRGSGSVELGS